MPRLDLHVHSSASFDAKASPEEVARRCRALGLDPVVLTDHDTMDGALRLQQLGVSTLAGQEITTTHGELIGLFLATAIPARLSPAETVERIHAQGGLVYLQHPYDSRRRRLREEEIERLADAIDIVEVWNGRSTPSDNRRAAELCATLGAVAAVGSDAHRLDEIGRAYVEVAPFQGPAEFLDRLRRARLAVEPNRLLLRARTLLGR